MFVCWLFVEFATFSLRGGLGELTPIDFRCVLWVVDVAVFGLAGDGLARDRLVVAVLAICLVRCLFVKPLSTRLATFNFLVP